PHHSVAISDRTLILPSSTAPPTSSPHTLSLHDALPIFLPHARKAITKSVNRQLIGLIKKPFHLGIDNVSPNQKMKFSVQVSCQHAGLRKRGWMVYSQ